MLLDESYNFIYEVCRYSSSDGAFTQSTLALEFCSSVICASSMKGLNFFVIIMAFRLNAYLTFFNLGNNCEEACMGPAVLLSHCLQYTFLVPG